MTAYKLSLLAGVALFLPLMSLPALAADATAAIQIAQATTADSQPPLTEEEKKKLELLKKKKLKAGEKPTDAKPAEPGKIVPQDKKIEPKPLTIPKPPVIPDATTVKPLEPSKTVPLDKKIEPKPLTTPKPPVIPDAKITKPADPAKIVPLDKKVEPQPKPPVLPDAKIIQPPVTTPQGPSGASIEGKQPDTKALALPGVAPLGKGAPKPPALVPAANAPAVLTTLAPPPKLDTIKKARVEHVDAGGNTVITEPGNRTIVKQGTSVAIQHDEADRLRRFKGADSQKGKDGGSVTSYLRPDGARVFTEADRDGHVLRVYRRHGDGPDEDIIDNRRFLLAGAGIGLGLAIALELSRPEVTIPRERYIVDYRRASDDDLYEALDAPPLDRLERAYSLDEIRYNERLRERMRRIDLDTVNFRSGASDPSPEQYPKLERLARVLLRVLERHPNEVFLVEGYTDAVGSELDNLSLSDRRAESVAEILTETFGVPPENLVTQGYGKQFLKIPVAGPERANRRVAVRRITPLMAQR